MFTHLVWVAFERSWSWRKVEWARNGKETHSLLPSACLIYTNINVCVCVCELSSDEDCARDWELSSESLTDENAEHCKLKGIQIQIQIQTRFNFSPFFVLHAFHPQSYILRSFHFSDILSHHHHPNAVLFRYHIMFATPESLFLSHFICHPYTMKNIRWGFSFFFRFRSSL